MKIERHSSTKPTRGSIIVYRENDDTLYDMICYDYTSNKFFALDLQTKGAKTSRLDSEDELVSTYRSVIEIIPEDKITLMIKD